MRHGTTVMVVVNCKLLHWAYFASACATYFVGRGFGEGIRVGIRVAWLGLDMGLGLGIGCFETKIGESWGLGGNQGFGEMKRLL